MQPFTVSMVDDRAEWCRPGDMRDKFGIGRSEAYVLINAGQIRSFVLRHKGNSLGIRLINCDSVRQFLARCEAEQQRPSPAQIFPNPTELGRDVSQETHA